MADEKKPTPPSDNTMVSVTRSFSQMVRTIADQRDCTMLEAMERYCRPAILREYKRVVMDLQKVFDKSDADPIFANSQPELGENGAG